MILLQSEVLELKANPSKRAVGTIIEARLDKGRGPVATVVIQEGTLRPGDVVVAGIAYGKVRALLDALGKNVAEAGPSKPVEVLGLSAVPLAGDKLHAMESEDDARQVAEHREKKMRETKQMQSSPAARLEDMYAKASQGEVPEVRVLIKGDVQGSVEALRESLTKMTNEKVRVTVLHAGVGAVTESDVMLAVASRAIVIGFNMRPDAKARALAESEKIQIRSYSIIYDVIDDMKKAMEGMLKPTFEEKYLGRAEVRQVFTVSKIGTIAGCGVTDGKIVRTAQARVLRDGKMVYEGKLSSLKRFKDDAREVTTGLECGIGIENFNDIKVGDIIEGFLVEEIAGKF
jgi:translation initiation factor IF-2